MVLRFRGSTCEEKRWGGVSEKFSVGVVSVEVGVVVAPLVVDVVTTSVTWGG
jgi:hypothetical protein